MIAGNRIGIMQGRLLPKVGGRIQAFPGEGWEREFDLAAEIGFGSIELTIEMASLEIHPACTTLGRSALTRLVRDTGVKLAGLCCDTFMERPLVSASPEIRAEGATVLDTLVAAAGEAGLPMVELPMLGDNSLKNATAPDAFAAILDRALAAAEKAGVDILLETDLDAEAQAAFLARHAYPRLGINYDCGNSTYFGYAPAAEIDAYGRRIRNVHIKDCTQADYSVPLGTGHTDFATIFAGLARIGYQGGFILQAARQADDLAAARDYLAFTGDLVGRYLAGTTASPQTKGNQGS